MLKDIRQDLLIRKRAMTTLPELAGYLAIPGKVAKKYFEEKFYGVMSA